MTILNKYASSGIAGAIALLASSSARAEAFEQRTEAAVPLSPNGGEFTTLLQQEVPAGIWIITAKSSLVSWGDADYVRCGLRTNGEFVDGEFVDGAFIDGSTTMIGQGGGMPAVATLYNQRLSTFIRPTTISLVCWHDFFIAGTYVDPGASLLLLSVLSCSAPEPDQCLAGQEKILSEAPDTGEISVIEATYGGNCSGVPVGNQTSTLKTACDSEQRCSYVVDYRVIGDPAPFCAKSYEVEYACNDGTGQTRHVSLAAEAGNGRVAELDCSDVSPSEDREPVCTQSDPVAAADACLAPPFIARRDYWYEPPVVRDGPLLDPCPRSQPWRWCTSFGYCWCSANAS